MSNFYGLIGEKLGHSLSPEIHGNILKKLNIKGTYSLFEIKRENLKTAVEGLKALGCRGVNVTMPYKVEIMQHLDKISKEAEKIGAVNTVAFSEEGLIGCNTDYYGFGLTLKRAVISVLNRKAVILGTGGVSKAARLYLMDNGAGEIIFVSRDPQAASRKIKDFRVIGYSELKHLEDKDFIINCTPCGMHPIVGESPVGSDVLSKFSGAVDLIYNPIETLFLKKSRELGLKTANGLFMLVAQAAAAQEIWQGVKLSDETLEEIYNEMQ
jgi:shikimate dehydrogenase